MVLILMLSLSLVFAKDSYSASTEDVVSEEALECNELEELEDRLSCRFENGATAEVPEACEGLELESECVSFYEEADFCYSGTADQKDACFQQLSGYDQDNSDMNTRWYIVALLYEIQEYVEDDYDSGVLKTRKAAEWIADIIEMKRAVLSGEDLEQVAVDLEVYRNERQI